MAELSFALGNQAQLLLSTPGQIAVYLEEHDTAQQFLS